MSAVALVVAFGISVIASVLPVVASLLPVVASVLPVVASVLPVVASVGPAGAQSCQAGYSPCLPIVADLDCGEIGYQVQVTGADPYRLDADNDGIGCESYPSAPIGRNPAPIIPGPPTPLPAPPPPTSPPQPANPCATRPDVVPTATLKPIPPQRVLDTRDGIQWRGRLRGLDTVDVQISGCAGIPTNATGAVVLNLTSTEASAPSFVTVWPSGESRPIASSLNTDPGQDTPNLVMARIGAGGRVSMYLDAGLSHLVADIVGWLPGSAGFVPVSPARVLDTRSSNGVPTSEPVGPAQLIGVQITGRGGVPTTGVSAVALNLTSTQSNRPSFVTVWPAGGDRPVASSLNTQPGVDTPNLVVTPLSTDGRIQLYNDPTRGAVGHLERHLDRCDGACVHHHLAHRRYCSARLGAQHRPRAGHAEPGRRQTRHQRRVLDLQLGRHRPHRHRPRRLRRVALECHAGAPTRRMTWLFVSAM